MAPSECLVSIGDDGSEVKKMVRVRMMVTMVMMVIMLVMTTLMMMMNQKVPWEYLLLKTELALGQACNLQVEIQ